MKSNRIVILDNIRSAHNVGSIFRTSDGAGVEKVILGGYTPAPVDRFGRIQPEIAKTSLGASSHVSWEAVAEALLVAYVQTLQRAGYTVVAIEQTPDSTSLLDFSVPSQVCYIFGNEVDGVRKELLSVADQIVEIPMHGSKESLNVSVSAGVVLFHTLR